jgi:hypothetical protein
VYVVRKMWIEGRKDGRKERRNEGIGVLRFPKRKQDSKKTRNAQAKAAID